MCGICGVLYLDGQQVSETTITKMNISIAHRGPDGDGVWIDGSVGFGHRRLAIVDLTPSGHQPMSNETGELIIVFNGELYNHLSLLVELEAAGHQYHSRTDTETVIHAYEQWGTACLDHFNGMFAFVLWDGRSKQLFLARDRFGVKPLYYSFDDRQLIFASEIKAILAHPQTSRSICYPALNEYFTFQNILTDLTLFKGINILPADHFLVIKANKDAKLVKQRYYFHLDGVNLSKLDIKHSTGSK